VSSRENIQVSGNSLEEIKRNLNFALQRIADRMDKIEGARGTSTIISNLSLEGNSLINVGNFQDVSSDDTPTFGGLTIDGDMTLTGTFDTDIFTVTDANGVIIHQLGA